MCRARISLLESRLARSQIHAALVRIFSGLAQRICLHLKRVQSVQSRISPLPQLTILGYKNVFITFPLSYKNVISECYRNVQNVQFWVDDERETPKWMPIRFWIESLLLKSCQMVPLTRPKWSVCFVVVNWAIIIAARPVWNTTWWWPSTHTHTADANSPPPRQYQDLVSISFTLLLMDSVTLCERLFAPSENVLVWNWTVYMPILFSIKNICTKQADPLFHVDKSIKMRKNNGTKRNQETFRIDKNVRLNAINRELTMTLMRLIAIKYFNRLTALVLI